MLARVAVLGAYIKRRGNMMFITDKAETVDISELSRALDESFANIKLLEIECAVDCPDDGEILSRDAVRVYDFFEAVIEEAMESMSVVWLKVRSLADSFVINFEIVCEKSLEAFKTVADSCIYEDGAWCFTVKIGKAGG